jgi:hypothetical protein
VTWRSGRGLAAAALVATALVAATAHPVAARPHAPRWSEGACGSASGVTVVVDFQQLQPGAAASVGCASDPPSSGFAALMEAGFQVQPVTNQPFVCKIDGLPDNASCGAIPKGSYWSYWVAPRGGTWCYSQVGAGGRKPLQGTVEGWSYTSGSREGTTPPRVAPPKKVSGSPASIDDGSCPSPPTTTTTTTRPAPVTTAPPTSGTAPSGGTAPRPGSSTGGQGGTSTTSPAGATATTLAGEAAPSTSTDGVSVSSTTSSTAPRGEIRIRDDEDGGGSPAGAIAGGAAIAGLGLAAVLTARRRRHAGDPGLDP